MAWISIKTAKGVWKIKPRSQMRWAERTRKVRVIDLGLLVVSWWSHSDLQNLG
jgi:hypothetical protein